MASFSLVPWANRVRGGVVHNGSTTIPVGGTPIVGETDPIHGHGWIWHWDIANQHENEITLEMLHPAGVWPWRYRARQTITVEHRRLRIGIALENRSDTPMPYSMGVHPYFERPARITANVDGIWTGELIPDHWEEREAFRGTDVDHLDLDATFTGWDGRTILHLGDRRLDMAADTTMLHVYAPRGRGFFCAEPVTGAADALNHPERGGDLLAPGDTASVTVRLALAD
jgi:aldose 1-epimerase